MNWRQRDRWLYGLIGCPAALGHPRLQTVARDSSEPPSLRTGVKEIMARTPYRCAVSLMIETDEVSDQLCGHSHTGPPKAFLTLSHLCEVPSTGSFPYLLTPRA